MRIWLLAMMLCLALSPFPAFASERPVPSALAGLAPLPAEDLGAAHGRGGLDPELVNDGAVQGNSVGAYSRTGDNTITGSFNATGGMTTVFQNSGNNSLFQNSTVLSVTVR